MPNDTVLCDSKPNGVQLAARLRMTVDGELASLYALPEQDSVLKPSGQDSWSPRQELGHLIDSASNNHVRFVVAAIQQEFRGPSYAQNAWVEIHAYQERDWTGIVRFWSEYNHLIAGAVERIPLDQLETPCFVGSGAPVSLRFLIEDYIVHMQHHIDHLLTREAVTAYPRVMAPGA